MKKIIQKIKQIMNDVLVMAIIFGAFSIFNYVLRSYYSDIEQEAIKNIEAAIEQSQIKVNTQSKETRGNRTTRIYELEALPSYEKNKAHQLLDNLTARGYHGEYPDQISGEEWRYSLCRYGEHLILYSYHHNFSLTWEYLSGLCE